MFYVKKGKCFFFLLKGKYFSVMKVIFCLLELIFFLLIFFMIIKYEKIKKLIFLKTRHKVNI